MTNQVQTSKKNLLTNLLKQQRMISNAISNVMAIQGKFTVVFVQQVAKAVRQLALFNEG